VFQNFRPPSGEGSYDHVTLIVRILIGNLRFFQRFDIAISKEINHRIVHPELDKDHQDRQHKLNRVKNPHIDIHTIRTVESSNKEKIQYQQPD